MDITKSRDELILEAARKLNIVGTDQPLEAEYSARIDDNVDPLLMQLASDGICNIVSGDLIPSEWFDAVAGLLANICAPIAGKGYDPRIKDYYEMQLKRLTSNRPSYATQEAEYF